MGACGYFVSAQAVFFVTAVLIVPALLALRLIRERDVDRFGRTAASTRVTQANTLPTWVGSFARPRSSS